MKFIKSYDYFIKEELISGPNRSSLVVKGSDGRQRMNFSRVDSNMFTKIFNSDPLKLKEFMQDSLRDINIENIQFIAGGAIGLAFKWKDKVLKITTELSEKEGVEKMIQLTPGDETLPGFAKYYWIKEIELPESTWKKDSAFITDEEEEKIKKQRSSGNILLTPDEIVSRKKLGKMKKAYIICLDNVRILDDSEKEIAFTVFMLFTKGYLRRLESEDRIIEKLNKIYEWILSDEDEYVESEYLSRGLDKEFIFSGVKPGINKVSFFGSKQNEAKHKHKWTNLGKDRFLDFCEQIVRIYKGGTSLGIPTSDIHEDNLGYRGNSKELVAFDCM